MTSGAHIEFLGFPSDALLAQKAAVVDFFGRACTTPYTCLVL